MSNKISSGEKNYKNFIGYFYDDCKIKPLYLISNENKQVHKKL